VLKEEIGDYNNVAIEWIRGHAPTAYIKDDAGTIIDTFDLSNADHGEFLALLKSHNFVPLTNEAILPGSPHSSGSFGGHIYEYYQTSALWKDVESFVSSHTNGSQKGYLLTLTSPEEESYVTSLIPTPHLETGVWLGAQDNTEAMWNWIGGPERDVTFWKGRSSGKVVESRYQNWLKGEPNNGDASNEEDCAVLSLEKQKTGWTDVSCYPTRRFGIVVEYGDDAIFLPNITRIITNDVNTSIDLKFPSVVSLDAVPLNLDRLQPISPKTIFHGILWFIIPLLLFTIGFVLYSLLLTPRKKRDLRAWFGSLLRKWQPQEPKGDV